MGLLDGKVAVVTGAGGGLGRAHALALAKEGARIVVNDLGGQRDGTGKGSNMADAVVAEIQAAGGEAVANYNNVATVEGGEGIVKSAVDAFGRLDVLVNNAGILRDKTLLKMDEAMWDAVIAVHLKGVYCVTKPAVAQMRAQGDGGKVVNTSSYAGLKGNVGQANYGAAKAGIAGFTRVLGLELSRYGIEVNAIAPLAKTRMTDDIDMVPDSITPEQIAPFVVFLSTALSDGVTGRIFGVHGPEIFEYKQMMTPAAEKPGGSWTAQDIADCFDSFTRDPSFNAGSEDRKESGSGNSTSDKVSTLFHALPDGFKAEKAGSWSTVIHFDIQGTGSYTLTVKEGTCTVTDGDEGGADATVTFDSADTILGMAAGQVEPQQAFMAGKIKSTDIASLMKFGQYFDMRKAAVALSKAEGSKAKEQSPEALVDMIFERIHEGFLPERAGEWNALLHIEVGDALAYTVAIEKGSCRSMKGKEGSPSGTITFQSTDLMLDLVQGKLRPEQAFMSGKIKTDDMGSLMKFGQVFDLKKGAEEAQKIAQAGKSGATGGGDSPSAPQEGLNRACIGRSYKAGAVFVRPEEIEAYALATNDSNGIYREETANGSQIAPPLFAVKPLMEATGLCVSDKDLNADLLRLLHGEQEMTFHRPVKPWDLVVPRSRVSAIEDKSSGQLLQCHQSLWASGELVCEVESGYFIRGYTAQEGERAKKTADSGDEPASDVLFEHKLTVDDDQPMRYGHASGDMNPIHMDKAVAETAGLPNVILHGLCTMAFAQTAVVDQYLEGDAERLKRLKVRFSQIVLPGDVLTTRFWRKSVDGEREILGFETVNQHGKTVLSQAEAEVVTGG
jgi:NAD(P)-dependent dehydrogenase (short-subunit alcohol dehydrogenase family)/acyl dehydratase/putative sterol carrier protein